MNKNLRFYLILTILIFLSTESKAQFTIYENFKGSSVGSNIILGGNPNSATLTSGVSDPVNDGWLRITNDGGNQRGYAYINTSFPATLGVFIEFEYKTWRSNNDNYNGADGICVFLFDAAADFSIGGFGGSLGYANRNSESGLAGAYLGIGLDEYGNFARQQENRNGGTSDLVPNSITLRGPADNASPYRYLTHIQLDPNSAANGPNSIDYNTISSTRPDDNAFYRKVKISIEPIGTISDPKYRITVKWATSPTGTDTQHIVYDTTDPIPPYLKLGFSASTGGGFNYHEIRNLLITTPGGVRVDKHVNKVNATVGDQLTYTVNVYNETAAQLTNLTLSDLLNDANGNPLNAADFTVNSITFNNQGHSGNTATGYSSGTPVITGFSNPISTTLNMDANSYSSFTITGTVNNIPIGGLIKNTVNIDPTTSGITDEDLTNNTSTVSTNILSPNVDLEIKKIVDNNGITSTSGNTYTLTVTNNGANSTIAGNTVTVTDNIPSGFTVTNVTANGWTKTNTGNNYTFKRTDALGSAYSYPNITIKVTPPSTGGPQWVNTANVNYSGSETNLTNNSSSATLTLANPAIALVKTGTYEDTNSDLITNVGDHINYTFTVTNTGNVSVTGITIADSKLGLTNLSVTPANIAPGETATASVSYALTLADINTGKVTNTATATGKDPNDNNVNDTSGSSNTNDDQTVTVLPNVDPVANNDENTVTEGQTATGNVLSNDTDADGDALTVTSFTINSITYPAGTTVVIPNVGSLIINSDGNYIFIPDNNYSGNAPTATYTITDGTSTDTADLNITVIPLSDILSLEKTSDLPVKTSDGSFVWTYTLTVSNKSNELIDSISVSDDLHQIFYSADPRIKYTLVNTSATGTLTINPDFNGSTNIDLLAQRSYLNANTSGSILIKLKVTPNGFTGDVLNQAVINAKNPTGEINTVSDDPSQPGDKDPTITNIPDIGIIVPDGFTPNGDGINDNFVIPHSESLQIKIRIFNRWGNLVYESDDYQSNWDGRGTGSFFGKELPSGTYFCSYQATDTLTNKVVVKAIKSITLRR